MNPALYKRLPHLIILSASLLVVAFIIASGAYNSDPVFAQSCPSVDVNKGRVEYSFNVQEAGVYRVWTRMQAGNSYNNSVYLKVDSDCAINVGDTSVPSNSWKWVDYKNGDTGNKINVSLGSGNHVLRYFGKEKNVKVDTVVLLKESNCTPQGEDGKNCQIIPSSTSAEDSSSSGDSGSTANETKPNQPVKVGNVIINEDGEQVEIAGEDENGAYYIDEETGEKVYAKEELTEKEATEIGYLQQLDNRRPWIIGLGALAVTSVAVFAYTIFRPEQAHKIVVYQHKVLDSLKQLLNKNHTPKGPPPPKPPSSSGKSVIEPTIIHPTK